MEDKVLLSKIDYEIIKEEIIDGVYHLKIRDLKHNVIRKLRKIEK